MKKMFLSIALIIGLVSTVSRINAQEGRFSIGPEIGIPTSDDKDFYSLSIGGSLRYEYPIGENLGLTGTVGYLSYILKGDATGVSFSTIPIQVGLKYYFMEQQSGFYAMANLGVHSSTAKVEFLGTSVSASSTDLSYAPEIGYMLDNLDFGLRYQIISTEGSSTSYIGLRIAYVFGEK